MAASPAGKRPAKKPPVPVKKPAATKKAAGIAVPKKAAPKPKASPKPKPPPRERNAELTDKQQQFVVEYLIDLNATQAAIRAGYSAVNAGKIGPELLGKTRIAQAIAIAKQDRQGRTEITADAVLREIWDMFRADPRELVEVRVGCCRHCYGEGHKRQRTLAEFNADRERWLVKGENPGDFNEEGGIGYNPLLTPHALCPECGGTGYARSVIHDTRKISAQAASLYAGAKETKYGIEILLHDKVALAEKLAKHLGLYEADNAQKRVPLQVNSTVTFVRPPQHAEDDDE